MKLQLTGSMPANAEVGITRLKVQSLFTLTAILLAYTIATAKANASTVTITSGSQQVTYYGNENTRISSQTLTGVSFKAGDIVMLEAGFYLFEPTSPITPDTVTSITRVSGLNPWHHLVPTLESASNNGYMGSSFAFSNDLWYAVATATVSNASITANFAEPTQYASLGSAAYGGLQTTSVLNATSGIVTGDAYDLAATVTSSTSNTVAFMLAMPTTSEVTPCVASPGYSIGQYTEGQAPNVQGFVVFSNTALANSGQSDTPSCYFSGDQNPSPFVAEAFTLRLK